MNILQAAFALIFFCQKLQSQTVTREKLRKALLYEKVSSKMLVKLSTCPFYSPLAHPIFFFDLTFLPPLLSI